MKLNDILVEDCMDCDSYEVVYVDNKNNVYDEDHNLIGTADQLDEDWGSSDWNFALDMFKKELEHGTDMLDAAESVAEFYNDDHHEWEKFSPASLLSMAQRRGLIDHTGNLIRDDSGKVAWAIKRGGKPIEQQEQSSSRKLHSRFDQVSNWDRAVEELEDKLRAGMPLRDAARDVAVKMNTYTDEDPEGWDKFSPRELIKLAQRQRVLDQEGNLMEASKRQWKRFGTELRKRYRCTSGPKKGKLVSDPSKCASRKDPKKVRQGRKLMRTKKNTIARKSKIAKRRQISKMVTRMNQRLMGKSPSSSKKRRASGMGLKKKSAVGTTTKRSKSTKTTKKAAKPKKPR